MERSVGTPNPGARNRLLALSAAAILVVAACGTGSSSASPATSAGATAGTGEEIGVTLITKTSTNPFFVAMAAGAQESADSLGIDLTTAAGKEDGDTATQIQAIENAISKGDKG